MPRPSKLSDRQWAEIGRRLASGEKLRALAKEFRLSPSTISERFSERVETIRGLASTLADVEQRVERLPINEQTSVRTLADQLKRIGDSVSKMAATSAETGVILADLAQRQAHVLRAAARSGETVNPEDFRTVAALQETANRAVAVGTTLLTANKGQAQEQAKRTLEELVTGSKK